ncbi:MAG: ABC transporter permease [Anaerolineales bacterium]
MTRNIKPPFFEHIMSNPVILKEMRSRMRGWRSTITLTVYAALMSGFVGLIYLSFNAANRVATNIDVREELGKAIFFTVYGMELLAVCLITPSLTAGAISSEREHRTYDLLRTTLLSARSLVLGKLTGSISFVLLLLFAALPLQSIAFMFGGITLAEVVIGTVVLVLTAINLGALGLFFSSFVRRTRIATTLSSVSTIMIVFGAPGLALALTVLLDVRFNFSQSLTGQIVIGVIGWLCTAASPFATAIASEIILVEENAIFFFQATLKGVHILVPSPWIGFAILYPLFTLVLLMLAIRFVKRAER